MEKNEEEVKEDDKEKKQKGKERVRRKEEIERGIKRRSVGEVMVCEWD